MMADIDLYSFLGVIAIILGKVDTENSNIWYIGQTNNGLSDDDEVLEQPLITNAAVSKPAIPRTIGRIMLSNSMHLVEFQTITRERFSPCGHGVCEITTACIHEEESQQTFLRVSTFVRI